MRIQKFNFENNEFMQLYLAQEESPNENIMQKINKTTAKKSNIAIFIPGANDTQKVLAEIINYKKNKNIG